MITYRMSGYFGGGDPDGHDFFSEGRPLVDMCENPEDVLPGEPAAISLADDGCYEVSVVILDEFHAKAALAKIDDVSPSEIQIIQLGLQR